MFDFFLTIFTVFHRFWPFLIAFYPIYLCCWPLLTTIDRFWQFVTIFDYFWPFFLYRFWPSLTLFDRIDHCNTVIDRYWPCWPFFFTIFFFFHFWPFLTVLQIFLFFILTLIDHIERVDCCWLFWQFWPFLTVLTIFVHSWPYIIHIQEGQVLVVCYIFWSRKYLIMSISLLGLDNKTLSGSPMLQPNLTAVD